MKRLIAAAAATLAALTLAAPLLASGKLQGYAEIGGQTVLTSLTGASVASVRLCPGASVTPLVHGTTTGATTYRDEALTQSNGATFTANSRAEWSFYANDGDYDLQFSGCSSSWTLAGLRIGGGVTSVSIPPGVCDGITNATATIQAANDVAGPHAVLWPAGTCLVTDTITVTQPRVSNLGQGEQATIIKFQPASGGKAVFKLTNGAFTIAQSVISGFGFTSTNTTLQKIMVEVDDGEEVEISHIASAASAWTGATSEGVRSKGRQFLHFHDSTIATDLDIHLMQDPNFPGLDGDHYLLENLYLIANGNPNILADANVVLTNTTFHHHAWVSGTAGFKWLAASASASNTVTIDEIRKEQEQSATDYIIEAGSTSTINGMVIRSVYGGLSSRGIKLRKISNATVANYQYVGSSVALDIDATVDGLVTSNILPGFSANGATTSIVGQREALILPKGIQAVPLGASAFYQSTSSSNPSDVVISGVHHLAITGCASGCDNPTLANGANINLISFFNGTERTITFTVSARNNLTNAVEGGVVVGVTAGAGNLAAVGKTTNFDSGNTIGKLTLLWQGIANVILLNQLGGGAGATVDYTVEMTWK